MPLGAVQISNSVNAQCCGCCMDYGITKINLNCDKNFAMTGDSLTVTGIIDHSGGKS